MTILAAALTFIGVAAYVNSVSSQVGPMTRVVRLTTDVAAMHPIAQSDIEVDYEIGRASCRERV